MPMLQSEQELRKQFDTVVKSIVDHARKAAEESSGESMKNLEQATKSLCSMLDDSESLIGNFRKTIDDTRPAIESAASFAKQFDALRFSRDFEALTESVKELQNGVKNLNNQYRSQGDKIAQILDSNVTRILSEALSSYSSLSEEMKVNKRLLIGLYALVAVLNVLAVTVALKS